MPKIITQVDRLIGNYEEVFVFSIDASFNGVEGSISSAEIRLFIPDFFTIFPGDIQKPFIGFREEVVPGGTNYVFDLGSIEDLGIAVRLGIGLLYQTNALNGTSYAMTSELWINGMKNTESQSESITLQAIPRFELSREQVLPNINAAPGGIIFYRVQLENFGDLGSTVQNVSIRCNGDVDLQIDPNYTITGRDISSGSFTDPSADGIIGRVENNQIIFTLPQYRGTVYEFIYRCILSDDILIGSEINTTITWEIDNVPQEPDIATLTLGDPLSNAAISVYGPDYTLPNEKILYELNLHNTGNQKLQTVVFEINLPSDVKYESYTTGTFHIGSIKQDIDAPYTIRYTTTNGQSGILGTFNTSINSFVDLSTLIGEGDNLSSLTIELVSLDIGVRNKISPALRGTVGGNAPLATTLLNRFQMTWLENETTIIRNGNQSAVVEDICVLNPLFSQSASGRPIRPGQTFRYTIGASCYNSRLNTPILATLLPNELEFIGNESIAYNEVFNMQVQPTLPPATVIENFTEKKETLVSFVFSEEFSFNFTQKSVLRISFDVKVKPGAKGTITSTGILNSMESRTEIPSSVSIYEDVNNIAFDESVSIFYAQAPIISNAILFFVSTSSNKKVRGLLDNEYTEEPLIGSTVSGGSIDYKIQITNIGNADLESIEVVDILPYQGDTGVIETGTPRNSQYHIYNISEVVARITDDTGSIQEDIPFDIYYSTSRDPIRFGGNFDLIGTDDNWSLDPPEDLTSTQAIKVKTLDSLLLPNQSLELLIKAIAPNNVPVDFVAWNTFAADVSYFDFNGTLQRMLAIEPEKVGIRIRENPPDKGMVTGFVWLDEDRNGLYENTETRLNDIGVVLYDEGGQPLQATFTTTTFDEKIGYYSFNNLDYGNYRVKFFIDTNHYRFTKQQSDFENGSSADSKGIVPIFNLSAETDQKTIIAGIVPKSAAYNIETVLKMNRQARSTIRNVIYSQMLLEERLSDIK